MSAGPRPRVVVGVGIDADALVEPSGDPVLRRAVHEELLEDLVVHGRLVFASADDLDAFVAAVHALPPTLAKAWEAVLSSRRLAVEVHDPALRPGLAEVLDLAVLEQGLGEELQLALLQSDHAEIIGVPPDDYSALGPAGRVEAGRLSTGTRTAALRAARDLIDAPLRVRESRETAWEERFGPLVAASKVVVVFDRFVGQQVARRYVYDRASDDGLTWFLSRVAMVPGRRVRVITSVTDSERELRMDEEVLALAFRRLRGQLGRDVRLEVVLVPDRVRSGGRTVERFGHDRHLRFGDRVALALGTGCAAFAAPRFPETVTVARLPLRDARDREERAVQCALRPPAGGWLATPG